MALIPKFVNVASTHKEGDEYVWACEGFPVPAFIDAVSMILQIAAATKDPNNTISVFFEKLTATGWGTVGSVGGLAGDYEPTISQITQLPIPTMNIGMGGNNGLDSFRWRVLSEKPFTFTLLNDI